MPITFPTVQNIFSTLPTGYYLGRKIKINLSEESASSYYDVANDTITISAPMIIDAVDSHDIKPSDYEELIRGLLYHEVSHVILTGPKPTKFITPDNKTIVNILEDERIETIFHDYYMNVDFRKNIFNLNNFDGEAATSVDSAFYQLVRFHIGTDEWINKLFTFIKTWSHLNASSDEYYWKHYVEACVDFYNEFEAWYKSEATKKETAGTSYEASDDFDETDEAETDSSSSVSIDLDDNSDDDSDDSDENDENDAIDMPAPSNKDIDEMLEDIPEINQDYSELISTALNEVFNKYENTKLQKDIVKILDMSQKKKGMFAGSRQSYSGKVNPKACGREDFKWWKKHTNSGNINGIAKTHFNLFIDNSGSFSSNDDQINTFIHSLNNIKSSTFDFDVITMATDIVEWPDTHQIFKSDGGNHLTANIHEIFRRHQKPGHNNFNIVLFDGDAHSNDLPHDPNYTRIGPNGKDNFSAFDTENTIIISSSSNKRYIDESVTRARVTYTSSYTRDFIKEILTLLSKVM